MKRILSILVCGEGQTVPTYLFQVDNVENGKHKAENTSVAKFDFDGITFVK